MDKPYRSRPGAHSEFNQPINLIFNAIADHMPDLKPISAPERLRSGWLNGIKHWQVDYTGGAVSCPVDR
jgi:cholest-4-en-3-one 26-monooxygenase